MSVMHSSSHDLSASQLSARRSPASNLLVLAIESTRKPESSVDSLGYRLLVNAIQSVKPLNCAKIFRVVTEGKLLYDTYPQRRLMEEGLICLPVRF